MDTTSPEDPDPGTSGDPDGASPDSADKAFGCTVMGLPNCNCLRLTGEALHVSAIIPIARNATGDHTGTWQVWVRYPGQSDYHLFLRSVSTTLPNGDHSWRWTKGGVGWDFPDGTSLEGGFKLSDGTWFDSGPAALTIHS